ncbi:MAG: PQQ-dependent sugar dehydrogenase [Phycisphaerales bacterium]
MIHRVCSVLGIAAVVLGLTTAVSAQTPLDTVRVGVGLVRPIFVTHAPGDFNRLFVIEKQGLIRIIKRSPYETGTAFSTGQLLGTPFLNIDPIVTGGTSTSSEQGLLGLAFHPNYFGSGAGAGEFYVFYTSVSPANANIVARYTVSANPDVANTAEVRIFNISDFATNHNGGWMAFGPNDGYLYIATGDGGSGCDPNQNGPNINALLGKILRVDVTGAATYTIPVTNPFVVNPPAAAHRQEIWAYGLRNPWRPAFDRATGDLWIADVGQIAWEEINFQAAAETGVRNYGWDCREGLVCSTASACTVAHCGVGCTEPAGTPAPFTNPIHVYDHGQGCSVTGGHVYRGCAIPDLHGTYFFADYCTTSIWSLKYNGTTVTNFTNRSAELAPGGGLSIASITSFGEDAFGEMYICDQDGGEVFKIVPQTVVGPDCNNNGRRDSCDIASGYSSDNNADGVPDECNCYANCNGDYSGNTPVLSVADFGCFQGRYVVGHMYADCNNSGTISVADFGCFQGRYVLGCP